MTFEMRLHFGVFDMVYGISVQTYRLLLVLLYITYISEAELVTLQFWFDNHSVGILIRGCFPDKHFNGNVSEMMSRR